MGRLLIAVVDSREALDTLLAKDAYYPDLANYEVREFQANLISDQLVDYCGK